MAEEKVSYDLVSPEKLLSSGQADMIVVPGVEGDFGVLPGHAPIISTIRPGQIEIHESGQEAKKFLISGGVCEVSADCCTVLADEVVPIEDLDKNSLNERLKQAETKLSQATTDDEVHHASGTVDLLKDMLSGSR